MIKLLTGGSPCTHWSIARSDGKRETKAEGLGWELFKNFLIAKEKYKPDYFLYENNKSMSKEIKAQITAELGVEPILINSALVSAQSRQRYYWTNIPNVEQPKDKGLLLKDILDEGACWDEKAYTLKASYFKSSVANFIQPEHGAHFPATGVAVKVEAPITVATIEKAVEVETPIRIGTIENNAKNPEHDSKQYRVYSPEGKSTTICGEGGGVGAKTGLYATPLCVAKRGRYTGENGAVQQNFEAQVSGKTNTLTTVQKDNMVAIPLEAKDKTKSKKGNKADTVYEVVNGRITMNDEQHPINLPDGHYVIRKLSVNECKKLQTVPEWYDMSCVSNSQGYRCLGNGWTIDVIAHIMSHIPKIKEDEVEVFSMYDGMSCSHIALDTIGAWVTDYYATEIDKNAVKVTQHNYPDTIQLGDAFQVREDNWCLYEQANSQ